MRQHPHLNEANNGQGAPQCLMTSCARGRRGLRALGSAPDLCPQPQGPHGPQRGVARGGQWGAPPGQQLGLLPAWPAPPPLCGKACAALSLPGICRKLLAHSQQRGSICPSKGTSPASQGSVSLANAIHPKHGGSPRSPRLPTATAPCQLVKTLTLEKHDSGNCVRTF